MSEQTDYTVRLHTPAYTEVDVLATDEDEARRKAEAWANGKEPGQLNTVWYGERGEWTAWDVIAPADG